jgi:hypothetical protein
LISTFSLLLLFLLVVLGVVLFELALLLFFVVLMLALCAIAAAQTVLGWLFVIVRHGCGDEWLPQVVERICINKAVFYMLMNSAAGGTA